MNCTVHSTRWTKTVQGQKVVLWTTPESFTQFYVPAHFISVANSLFSKNCSTAFVVPENFELLEVDKTVNIYFPELSKLRADINKFLWTYVSSIKKKI